MWDVLHFLQEHWIITVIVIVALVSSYIIVRDIQNAPIESNPRLYTTTLFAGIMGSWVVSYYYLDNNGKHQVYLISAHLVDDENSRVNLKTKDFLPDFTDEQLTKIENIIYFEHTNKPNPLVKV